MMTHLASAIGRRQLLKLGAALAGAAALPEAAGRALAAEPSGAERRLTAAPARLPLVGEEHPATAVYAYDGAVPGPELRIPQGRLFAARADNRLAEDTTVHWHGIRLPNAMDGVPGLTQPPIEPGSSFLYEFSPPDAGTFLYHPHDNSLEQMGRGLAGALIVEPPEPFAADRELVWVIQDWRLSREAQIAPGFGNGMEAAMTGRVGNTVTINGLVPDAVPVRAGERIRLRIVNAATARIIALGFEGHRPVVIALDGQPCDPHQPSGRLLLGPAMRADLVLDAGGEPGSRHAVTDDFYGSRLAYTLVELAYDRAPPLRARPPSTSIRLPPNPLPQPDLAAAERHVVQLQGGMMGGIGMMGGMMGGGPVWAINGKSMTGDGSADMTPMLILRRGASCVLVIRNETAWWHPMHLHGHSFRLLSRNGAAVAGAIWGDTVLVAPRETVEIAFVADNPGNWLFHCHVMDHQMAGLMTVIRVA
jgi:FtsP/CotA-like multicopper oxidase with cupredoxin domain